MKWLKRGFVWGPDGSKPWSHRYATCPTPIAVDDGRIRVFVQSRDDNNVGRIGYVDVLASDPTVVLGVSDSPVLDVGLPGMFDDSGVFQTSVLKAHDGRLLMYFVGFELCRLVPYRLLTGLAVSADGGESFQKLKETPVLERSEQESMFRCGTFVLQDPSGIFRMWYVAGSHWTEHLGKTLPVYEIRYLESPDGVTWPCEGKRIISTANTNEHGFGRPYVVRQGERYEMFFSVRLKDPGASQLCYATSADGVSWKRRDAEIDIEEASGDWDFGGRAFPAVIEAAGRRICFYNGRDFGVDGFGVAELVSQ